MTLSWEEFARFAVEFAKHSQTIGEDWQWVVREPDRMGMSYLAKEKVRRDVSRTTSPHSEEVEIDSLELRLSAEEIQEEQNTILQHQLDRNVHIYDYHVVYSTSYAAPVLYFRGYQEDGKPLGWDEVWNDLPDAYRNEEQRWNFITQQEHPVLGFPCFFIHPCETSKLMQLVQPTHGVGVNYLLTWLSFVTPVVALKVPLSLVQKSLLTGND